jgi:hypothetical protein
MGNHNIMDRLFVRFGLPWLIFGSAIFALYWTIWHGDSALSVTPPADFVQRSSQSQPAKHSVNVLAGETARAPSRASNSSIATNATPSIGASVTMREQPQPVSAPVAVEVVEKSPAAYAPPTTEATIQQALHDVDPKIRYHALAESEAQGIAVPAPTLQQMATSDRDPGVRVMAMIKFSQDPSVDPAMVRAVAEAGLRAGNAAVSDHARDMLVMLDQAARSNDEIPELQPEDAVQ